MTHYFVLIIMMMVCVAFFSLLERKVLGLIHYRVGPSKVSIGGLLQPIADAMKLLSKDESPVFWSNSMMFYLSPILMLSVSLGTWLVFPFFNGSNLKLSMIVLMIFLGMTIYGMLVSGWSSNSKYALIGSMRSVSQSLSYEVVLSFILLSVMMAMASYSLYKFYDMFYLSLFLTFPPIVFIFVATGLAELNRSPFDLSEGESELVSGYSVEYGGVMYTLLFLSENASIFVTSFMISFFFFMKSLIVFWLVWSLSSIVICVIRGVVPRVRYDLLMTYCWMVLLPASLLSFNFLFSVFPML